MKQNRIDGQNINSIASSKLSAKGRRLVRNKICVTLFYKGYRRLVRIDPAQPKKRQRFLLEREYQNMIRDINSPFIRNEYKFDN